MNTSPVPEAAGPLKIREMVGLLQNLSIARQAIRTAMVTDWQQRHPRQLCPLRLLDDAALEASMRDRLINQITDKSPVDVDGVVQESTTLKAGGAL